MRKRWFIAIGVMSLALLGGGSAYWVFGSKSEPVEARGRNMSAEEIAYYDKLKALSHGGPRPEHPNAIRLKKCADFFHTIGISTAERECLRAAQRFENTSETYFLIGQIELEARDLPAARKAFLRAIEWDSDRPDYHWYLGYTVYLQGKPEERERAIQYMRHAWVLDPEFVPPVKVDFEKR